MLLLGTSNQNKVSEILQITGLNPGCVTTPRKLNIQGEPVEDGDTFQANAIIKAMFYGTASGLPVLAEDTGLEVAALDGQPGLRSARFAGFGHDDRANREKLIGLIRQVDDRSARFVCHAVMAVPVNISIDFIPPGVRELSSQNDFRLFYAFGRVQGEIVTQEAGQGGFGYDPIFFFPGSGLTFAQIPQEQKNRISHRANAIRQILPLIRQICGEDLEGR